jgi:phosphatidylethanolamine-binding protein (PEBP) family uncharacterized protein
MYDPDAIHGNRFHWIVINIVNDIKNGNDLLPYSGAAPPPKSGTHHYIFELYVQDGNIDMHLKERNIPLDFVKTKLNIEDPISVVYFISKNQSGGKKKKRTKRKRTKRKKTKRQMQY